MKAKLNQIEQVVFFDIGKNRLKCTNFAHFYICNKYISF